MLGIPFIGFCALPLSLYKASTRILLDPKAHSSEESFGEAALLRAIRPKDDDHAVKYGRQSAVKEGALIKKAVDDWLKMPPNREIGPLEYWRSVQSRGGSNQWLLLLARHLFSIPGSNATLERAFSHAGRAVNPKRASLSAKRAEATIFLHENYLKGHV